MSIKEKIETVCGEIYGADGVDYSELAQEKIRPYNRLGFNQLPLCMARTHLSLSHDPARKSGPTGYRIPIRGVSASVGAGFHYPLLDGVRTMPGLPARPAFYDVDLDLETGKVLGLF